MKHDPEKNLRKSGPVAIIGIGCMFPKAKNLDAYWSNIREGVDAITDMPDTHWHPDDYHDEPRTMEPMEYY